MKSPETRRGLAASALALLVLLPVSAPSAPAPAAPAAARTRPATSKLTVALPDTVLARVFTGAGAGEARDITRRQMIVAAGRAGRRLDTFTPKDRREFLDVLVDQAVLVAQVAREPRRWDRRDSSDWNQLRDRLVLRAALDSAMVELNFERATRGDSLLPPQAVGVLVRDQAVAKLAPTWNDENLLKAVSVFDTLPKPDSRLPMIEQIRIAGVKPVIGPADSARVLAKSEAGDYTLGDLVRDFTRLNPLYRPRVSSVGHVRDMVANVLFEHVLRRAGAERGLERRPDIAATLAERAEYLDVQRYVAREVYERIAMDSLTLQGFFERHRGEFDFDERAHVVSTVLPDRAAAEDMVRQLTVPGEAESLAARSARAGAPYATVLSANSDTALFSRMRRGGAGAVLGPDSTRQGWRALRVMELEPKRPRTFAQAEAIVRDRWYGAEGERLMRELLDRLRRHAVVRVNDKALAAPLVSAGAGAGR